MFNPHPSDPVSEQGGKFHYAVGRSNEELHKKVREVCEKGHFALTLGGDHSVAMGSLS